MSCLVARESVVFQVYLGSPKAKKVCRFTSVSLPAPPVTVVVVVVPPVVPVFVVFVPPVINGWAILSSSARSPAASSSLPL